MERRAVQPIMRFPNALPICVMRMNLKVPFAEKEQAKKLGARWDAARKLWYIEGQVEVATFSRWSPTPHDASAPPPQLPRRESAEGTAVSHAVHVGSRYVELPRVCECLPWDDCDKCRLDAKQT